ncbi:MAG: hypothetical protein HY725_06065 [Candidatus Rokubacteria bacterium]|nr:hypothetical protein [Candidatus Rokubacteria bacterium]
MKYLYKYPQAAFPYARLVEENRRRDRRTPEYELLDTGLFEEDRYWDVLVEYAKADPDDILIRITVTNRGPEPVELHLLPTLWFRNSWSWDPGAKRPQLRVARAGGAAPVIEADDETLGLRWLFCGGAPELLFTENGTNLQRLYGAPNPTPFVKDGINDYVVHGNQGAVNPERVGTKAAVQYRLPVGAGESATIGLELCRPRPDRGALGKEFDRVFARRIKEADEFYATAIPEKLSDDARRVMRQAFAGLLWSKQFYHYDLKRWLEGDPAGPPPPPERRYGRNREWTHLYNEDIISMPDKWEYPWYAAWDLAFHDHPYVIRVDGMEHRVDYEPAESSTGLFGGNSNWRGPVWVPINYLLIEALQKFHHFYGDGLKVECPSGSGQSANLWETAAELSRRLTRIFVRDAAGRRPVFGGAEKFQRDPHWRDLILFYEYFHGDNGAGIGASHQTGWTGLVAKLLQQSGC